MDKKVRDYLAKLARRGGQARAKALTPAQRRMIAKAAIAARWSKRKKKDT